MDITCTVNERGNLVITADAEAREDITDRLQRYGFWTALWDALEPYAVNGSYEPFCAGDANPYVGLTDAPCIAESMTVHDDGQKEIDGDLWWFPNYMVEDPLQTLIDTGEVVFQKA